jgi:uncharacterized membrane protein
MSNLQFHPQRQLGEAPRPVGYTHFIHNLLTTGVVLSSSLLTAGLVLALTHEGALPAALPPFSQVIPLALAFQPAGLIALGLLALIATPILCVFGLMIIFLVERDWRYVAITGVVFLIVLTSILSGRK